MLLIFINKKQKQFCFLKVFNPVALKAGNLLTTNVSLGHLKILDTISVENEILNGKDHISALSFLEKVVKKSKRQTIAGVFFVRS